MSRVFRRRAGGPRRIPGEFSDVHLDVRLAASEYLEVHAAAIEAGIPRAEYVRRALAEKYNREHPGMFPFGERFR